VAHDRGLANIFSKSPVTRRDIHAVVHSPQHDGALCSETIEALPPGRFDPTSSNACSRYLRLIEASEAKRFASGT